MTSFIHLFIYVLNYCQGGNLFVFKGYFLKNIVFSRKNKLVGNMEQLELHVDATGIGETA